MANDPEMEARIAAEKAEIDNAQRTPVQRGSSGRCSFCGRIAAHLVFVEQMHGHDRYKGVECCGG